MKHRELVKKLQAIGFELHKHGGNHDIYKRGNETEVIPRHNGSNTEAQ